MVRPLKHVKKKSELKIGYKENLNVHFPHRTKISNGSPLDYHGDWGLPVDIH